MKEYFIIVSVIFLLFIVIFSKFEITISNALIVENNPFYGLSNDRIETVEATTADNSIKVKLEYAPKATEIGSPEFFKAALYYLGSNEPVLHADTDIVISKNGTELFKESNDFSRPFVHTPNGIILSSYKFPESGQYEISVKILGINFMPVSPQQVNFETHVTDSQDRYLIKIVN
jgi:hypothetical protein